MTTATKPVAEMTNEELEAEYQAVPLSSTRIMDILSELDRRKASMDKLKAECDRRAAEKVATDDLLAEMAKIDNYLSKATTLDGHTDKPSIRRRRDEIASELNRRDIETPDPLAPVFPYGKMTA